jgi:FkbM family methyltransferase
VYSQNDEDGLIMTYFAGRVGSLLDIGAYDGVSFSNSRWLIESGWSGVLVEPLPEAAEKCRGLYAGNTKVTVHELALGPEDKRAPFHVSGMMSTIDAAYEIHRQKWHALTFSAIEVNQITLDALLTIAGRSFDFISIDVENYNIDLVRQLPADVWQGLRCLCVEHDGHVDEIQRLARPFGLETIGQNAENLILAASS